MIELGFELLLDVGVDGGVNIGVWSCSVQV